MGPPNNIPTTISQVELGNGMTANVGKEQRDNKSWWLDTNGTFIPWDIYGSYQKNVPLVNGTPALRPKRVGVLQNVMGSLPNKEQYGCYFQYNPTEISVEWAMDSSQQAPYIYSAGLAGQTQNQAQGFFGNFNSKNQKSFTQQQGVVPNLMNGQSLSFSLLFDRTYSMLYDTNPDENRGVLKDVAALYNVMGTFETIGATPMSLPVQVMFGQTASGQIWGFTGNITSLSITYGIFRGNMIPSRCEVDVQMSIHYVLTAGGTGGGNGGGNGSAVGGVTSAGQSAAQAAAAAGNQAVGQVGQNIGSVLGSVF